MNILVAYDGTDGARRAVSEAISLAQASNAQLTLVHVLNPRADAAKVQAESMDAAVREVARRAEEDARNVVGGYENARVIVEIEKRGEDPGEAIVRIAKAEGADVIAIATRRAGGLKGFFLGSVTQQVIERADRPVLVVHA